LDDPTEVPGRPPPLDGIEVREWLAGLVESLPGGSLFILNAELRYVDAAGDGIPLLGLSAQSLIGKRMADLFSEANCLALAPHFDRALAGKSISFNLPFCGVLHEFAASPIKGLPALDGHIVVLARPVGGRTPALGPNRYGLSDRELRILDYMSDGYTDKQIAVATGRSVFTINQQVRSILAKLNARSRTEACVRVIREGLLPD